MCLHPISDAPGGGRISPPSPLRVLLLRGKNVSIEARIFVVMAGTEQTSRCKWWRKMAETRHAHAGANTVATQCLRSSHLLVVTSCTCPRAAQDPARHTALVGALTHAETRFLPRVSPWPCPCFRGVKGHACPLLALFLCLAPAPARFHS